MSKGINGEVILTASKQVEGLLRDYRLKMDEAYSQAEGKLKVTINQTFEPKYGGLNVTSQIRFIGEEIKDSTSLVVFPDQMTLDFSPQKADPNASGCVLWCPIQGYPWACNDERYRMVCPLRTAPQRQTTVFNETELAEIEALRMARFFAEAKPYGPGGMILPALDGHYVWCVEGKREKRIAVSACLASCKHSNTCEIVNTFLENLPNEAAA